MAARDAGLRDERELFAMRIEDLDLERGFIHVPDSKSDAGVRSIPMSDRLRDSLRARCGERRQGWVFPSPRRSRSGHLTTIAARFRQARRQAGLSRALVLYCARHDFGTRLMAETGDLKLVMTIMGIRDVKTALRYQHPNLERARTALVAADRQRREAARGGAGASPATAPFTAQQWQAILQVVEKMVSAEGIEPSTY